MLQKEPELFPLDSYNTDSLLKIVYEQMIETINSKTDNSFERPPNVIQAALYHINSGGQRVRALLALNAGLALRLSADDAVTISTTCELLHNASLIHDDLQDLDKTRRNIAAVWAAFDANTAICCGDLLLSSAYEVLTYFSNYQLLPQLLRLVHQRVAVAIQGQSVDLSVKGRLIDDINFYQDITVAKSGALLSLPLELSLLAAGQEQWIHQAQRAVKDFAVGYQIADDINDVVADQGSGELAHSLNIIFVLKAAGHGDHAGVIARNMALQHLKNASKLAMSLPSSSGLFLKKLADQLQVFLNQGSDFKCMPLS